jgi:hypothetical protein
MPEKLLGRRRIFNNWYKEPKLSILGSISPSGKPVTFRHDSRESKKPLEGEEDLLGKEDLTPKERPEDPKRQVKKEKKPVGEEDRGEEG